jgi:hypothetical protein
MAVASSIPGSKVMPLDFAGPSPRTIAFSHQLVKLYTATMATERDR